MGPAKVPRHVGKVPVSTSDQRVLPAAKQQQPCQVYEYPTVLVARDDDGLNGPLVDRLRRQDYNVLEAHDWADVFHFVGESPDNLFTRRE